MTHHKPDPHVTHGLEEVTVPASVLDTNGRIQWLNRGATELVGDLVGQPFARAIAPEDLHLARAQFAKKVIGEAQSTEYNLTLLGADRRRVVMRVSSVPLYADGEVVAVFGVCYPAYGADGTSAPPRAETPELTARQYETLALLADGLGTVEIARRLGVADETARNHIRGLLRQLGVHSRLEAVVAGYRIGLLHARKN